MARPGALKTILLESIGLIGFASAAFAQPRDINIPADDLKAALDSYIRQSHVQLVYTVNDVEGQRSAAVEGHYDSIVALDLLLQGTNLSASRDASGAVIVSRRRAAPAPVHAQDNSVETVEVSSSRIHLPGFQSPTPVTVINLEIIERNAYLNIGDEIRDLPFVSGTPTQSSNVNNVAQTNAGIDTLSLRNLGAQRNLVLFDGQRVAISGVPDGAVDLSTIPSTLIQRVDVVTGGASAAWGSDAVTGVINIVINKTFTGFKGNAEYQNNLLVPVPRYHAEAAWGTGFLSDRGHFEIAGNWNISNTATFNGQNPHNSGRTSVYNPGYCAPGGVVYAPGQSSGGTCAVPTGARALMYVYNAGTPTYAQGGLVNGNTAGTIGSGLTSETALKGIMFAGPAAAPAPFNYGTVYNTNTCYNGCSNNQYTAGNPNWSLASLPYHDSTVFSYTSYQITPDVKMSVQLSQGRYSNRQKGLTLNMTTQAIYADNAYLAPSVRQRFACNGAASAACVNTLSNGYNPFTDSGGSNVQPVQRLVMGFDVTNNRVAPAQATAAVGPTQAKEPSGSDVWTMDNACAALGEVCSYYNRVFNRGSVQFDGSLGSSWVWSTYAAWSGLRLRETVPNDLLKTRLQNAIDSVRVTSSNVGSSGLQIGSIQCRALLNPTAAADPNYETDLKGCQPVNLFGMGNVSQAAFQWLSPGVDPSSGFLNQVTVKTAQTAAGFDLSGVLPWQAPAGEIAVASGFDYRLEQAGQYGATPIGVRNILQAGNFVSYQGQYHVEEGFLEINAPILKSAFVQTLNLNLAGRLTDYSSSGLVETWKIGLDSQVSDDFRLRGFMSSDIRAPTVYDLYNPGGANSQTCASWAVGGVTNVCSNLPGGNPKLVPEQANTTAFGVVFIPGWISGLTASLDWYDLRLHGAIFTVPYTTVIDRAKQGETAYCSAIITSDGSNICNYSQAAGTVVPQIIGVRTGAVNAARLTTAGFDVNIDYRFDLSAGEFSVGVTANYVYDWSRTLNGITFQGAGATGGFYALGTPQFKTTINLDYHAGLWNFGVQIHGAGDAVRDKGTEGQAGIALAQVTYAKVNGADVGVLGAGQTGEGLLPTNYVPWSGDIGGRVSYQWSGAITFFGAMDRVFPGNKTYRAGVRFRL